jgi:NAD(P)-dependent dehydrogenase (short-subunit alcohol dehydrogenase family)
MPETRTILLTGGNRGLGRATAERLARAGHRVVLTARDHRAGARAVAEIRSVAPTADVALREVDLASMTSVRRFTDAWDAGPIDVLFCSAGVMQRSESRRVTEDGFEETLAVNALAPLLLVHRLLPHLDAGTRPRIVLVSSSLHEPGSRGAPVDFDFDDPHLTRGYHPDRAYKNSKLAVLWLTYELARRLPPRPITANAICPGFVPTTAAASVTGFSRFFLRHVLPWMPFATSVETASRNLAAMAVDPGLEGRSGTYWTQGEEVRSSEASRDPTKAARFWALACGLLGLPDTLPPRAT